MIDTDDDMTEQVDELLREDPRLLPAAKLIGCVGVVYREAKPPKAPKAPKGGAKPPPRVDGSAPDPAPTAEDGGESGEVAEELGPPALPSPWHKVAVLAKANGLAKFENGKPILATVTVDGTLYEQLDGRGQRAALVIALRGLRSGEDRDGATVAVIERAPVRAWPDATGEAIELMAQLGPDGARGASLVGTLPGPSEIERLAEAIAAFRRRLDAGQDLGDMRDALEECEEDLGGVLTAVRSRLAAAGFEPPAIVAEDRHGDVGFYAIDAYGDGTPSSYEIGWGHGSRDSYPGAHWSAHGWALYEGSDLHDGHGSLRELIDALGPDVWLTLEDYKRDRPVKIEAVIDAARAWAELPPLAETPEQEIAGELPEDGQ